MDLLVDNVSPYAFVGLFPLSYFSRDKNIAVYLLLGDILFLMCLGLYRMVSLAIKSDWHIRIKNFIVNYVSGAWLLMILGLKAANKYWVGKVIVISTTAMIAIHISVWCYWYLDIVLFLRSTFEFLKNIPLYIMNTPELFVIICNWLRSISIGYVFDASNEYWDKQVNAAKIGDVTYIITGIGVIIWFVVMTIIVMKVKPIVKFLTTPVSEPIIHEHERTYIHRETRRRFTPSSDAVEE